MAKRAKTEQEKRVRNTARQIVDWFLDVLMSSSHDIPWEGRSVIGALVDFRGEIPQSSGFSGFCKLGNKVDRMRDWQTHHKLALRLMNELSDLQVEALCIDRAYRNRTKVAIDPFVPKAKKEIYWDDAACAEQLKCPVATFQKRVSDAYAKLDGLLEGLQQKAA